MGPDSHTPNGRLAAYLRGQFPREHATKRLAADIGCTPKAAENILAGHWPGARHWQSIARRFGRDVLEAVFAPDIDATLARLTAEERDLEERLERARAARRQVQGGGEGHTQRLAPGSPDRAAVGAKRGRG